VRKALDQHIPWRKPANCPSETQLDGFFTNELSARNSSRLQKHIQPCSYCQNRLSQRKAGFQSFTQLDPQKLLHRIQEGLAETTVPQAVSRALREMRIKPQTQSNRAQASPRVQPFARSLLRWAYGASAVLVIALLVKAFLPTNTGTPEHRAEQAVRIKGGLKFEVVRERRGVVEKASSNGIFYPGDRLRFVVDVPQPGNLMVIGQEADKKLYGGYPPGEEAQSSPVLEGPDQILPGAIELDDSYGREWFYLVFCPHAFSMAQIKATQSPGRIEIPADCQYTGFQLNKQGK
jgi:hypothetical protein